MAGSPSGEPARPPRPWAVAGLLTAIGIYIWCVGGLATTAYRVYLASFDLALYDQAVWLVAHGRWPLSSIFGNTLMATHLQPFVLPLAALYRLAPGPQTLIWVEVVAVALGAVPVYLLARSLTRSDLAAFAWALVYVNYPAAQYLVLHDFHFQPLAVPLFLCAVWLANERRWRPMAAMLVLAAGTQEDAGLAIAGFGLGLVALGQRRIGAWTAVAGLAYTLVAVKLVMPRFSPQGHETYYVGMYFGHLGQSLTDVMLSPLLRPAAWWGSLAQPVNARLLVALLGPVAFLTLAKPSWALGALGTLYFNLLGTFWATHTIENHYQGFVIPFVFAAAVGGGAWLSARLAQAGARPAVAWATPPLLALFCTLAMPQLETAWAAPATGGGYTPWFPAVPTSPLRRPRQEAAWRRNHPWAAECDRLVARIGPEDSVSAPPRLLHHVSGRLRAYRFPCPFYMLLEGFETFGDFTVDRFRAGLERADVDWVLLLTQPNSPAPLDGPGYAGALAAVAAGDRYELVEDTGALRLYRRR